MNQQQDNGSIKAEEAAKLLGKARGREYRFDNLKYYAWPQTCGSTAGPFKGMGGQTICTFTIEAWVLPNNMALLFCNGRVIKIVEDFKPGMRAQED